MSWAKYFEKNNQRPLRPLYCKAIGLLDSTATPSRTKVAIDLGCGIGKEAADLISRGWKVYAVDNEPSAIEAVSKRVPPFKQNQLSAMLQKIEDLNLLPPSNFVFAYNSLPFTRPDTLENIWNCIEQSLQPNGVFAGSFFGMNDDWVRTGHCAGTSENQLSTFFKNFTVIHKEETDKIGKTALSGVKHWHKFEIIAIKTLRLAIK